MSILSRFRERLVLGHVRDSLEDGELVLAWAHARVPGVRQPGVVVVTERRCVLHVASRHVEDRTSPWVGLRAWRLEQPARSRARLTLVTASAESVGELSLSSRGRARSASRVVQAIDGCVDVPCDAALGDGRLFAGPTRGELVATSAGSTRPRVPQLQAAPRRLRDHVRRVLVTVVGVAVLVLSLVFASPFVPGPGSLTAVAGIAILAREYEWARDLHVWASRQLERFLAWMRRRKQAVTQRGASADPDAESPQVREVA